MTKLIFGCGYLGARVARRWHEAGHQVTVVTRSRSRADGFEHHGYHAIVADVTQPDSLLELPTVETVLFSVGFDRSAGNPMEAVYAGGMRNVLSALSRNTGHVIYISTTGVYGLMKGEWVDEETPPNPSREGGKASLAAERVLASHSLGDRGIVLRLAGIYGPGRVPFSDKLKVGAPIPAVSDGHLNLIHVDDAANIVVAAAKTNWRVAPVTHQGPRVYCVSDGHPVRRVEYYTEVARLIGAPPPTFTAPDADSPRASRAEADRRVRNDRMRAELGVRLIYPNYRAGLAKILG